MKYKPLGQRVICSKVHKEQKKGTLILPTSASKGAEEYKIIAVPETELQVGKLKVGDIIRVENHAPVEFDPINEIYIIDTRLAIAVR